MNPQTLKYLKQDQIGKVIAKGLADVYKTKPQTPVKYLAQWLKNYSKNQKELANIAQDQHIKANNKKIFDSSLEVNRLKQQQKLNVQKANDKKIQNFKQYIQNHSYQLQLLEQEFPQFIQNELKLTGTYIGQLNYPNKKVTDQDTDQNAHLDTTAAKLINYIGSSVSHKDLMRRQTLSMEKGVTGTAFALAGQQEPPKANQQGQQILVQPKPKYVYVPNVVRQQKMHYFRLPKLGAFLAVPLVYNSWLSQPVFDAAFKHKKKYLEQLDEFNKQKEQQIKGFQTELQEVEKKLADLQAKGSDQTHTDPIKQQIKQIKQKISAKNEQKLDPTQPQLSLNKKQYVFAADSLGTDQQLKESQIKFITQMVSHFTQSCENKEKELLQKDVQIQINYIKNLEKPGLQTLQIINKTLQLNEQNKKQLEQIQNQNLKEYKKQQIQYQSLKTIAKEESKYKEAFLKLKQFRVVKFRQVIQNVLHFLGYQKTDINLPGKAMINWKFVKDKYITKQIYDKIFAYVVQGSKQGQFSPYCKTPALSAYFDEVNLEQIFQYNIGLGMIAKFIQKTLKHRIRNVQWRKQQKQQERKERNEIITKNAQIVEQKAQALQKHKKQLNGQQIEVFNEEDWSTAYDAQHPITEEPAEVQDDIDNDM